MVTLKHKKISKEQNVLKEPCIKLIERIKTIINNIQNKITGL